MFERSSSLNLECSLRPFSPWIYTVCFEKENVLLKSGQRESRGRKRLASCFDSHSKTSLVSTNALIIDFMMSPFVSLERRRHRDQETRVGSKDRNRDASLDLSLPSTVYFPQWSVGDVEMSAKRSFVSWWHRPPKQASVCCLQWTQID